MHQPDSVQDSPLDRRTTPDNSLSPRGLVARVRAYVRATLGVLPGVLLISFVAQNADAVPLRFLACEAGVSPALVVILALSAGAGLGAALNRRRC